MIFRNHVDLVCFEQEMASLVRRAVVDGMEMEVFRAQVLVLCRQYHVAGDWEAFALLMSNLLARKDQELAQKAVRVKTEVEASRRDVERAIMSARMGFAAWFAAVLATVIWAVLRL